MTMIDKIGIPVVGKADITNPLKKTQKTEAPQQVKFGDTMRNFLQSVNDSQIQSAGKMKDFILGKTENMAEVMAVAEEAQVNLQLIIEIRNKLIQAYQEINRTQI